MVDQNRAMHRPLYYMDFGTYERASFDSFAVRKQAPMGCLCTRFVSATVVR